MNLVTDVCNEALDRAGVDFTLGDIEEGSRPAQVLLRAYPQVLRQLLRSAHWSFARKAAPLTLLADATGNTPNVGTQVVPPGQFVFEYALPTDAMKIRFIPANWPSPNIGPAPGNITPPNPAQPLMTGLGQSPAIPYRIVPARWLEAMDTNYPPAPGMITWETQGVSPQGRTVILTNQKNAICVYTALMLYPSNWDVNFRAALVAFLASEIVFPLHKDKKLAMAIRPSQIAITKDKIMQARISDGNETGFPPSNSLSVDWMNARRTGGGGWMGGWGMFGNDSYGAFWGGWDQCGFSDGSSY